jgi:hypothetical protein
MQNKTVDERNAAYLKNFLDRDISKYIIEGGKSVLCK